MKVKICKYCGKPFPTKSDSRMYCSKKCRMEAVSKRRLEGGQPCYTCKKACGGCSWSKNFLPIVGWNAKPTIVKDSEGNFSSYKIYECPEYIKG